jgi:hypothetical protein
MSMIYSPLFEVHNFICISFLHAAILFSSSSSIALRIAIAPALHRGRWLSSIAEMLLRAAQAYST